MQPSERHVTIGKPDVLAQKIFPQQLGLNLLSKAGEEPFFPLMNMFAIYSPSFLDSPTPHSKTQFLVPFNDEGKTWILCLAHD